jgi:hypothetical protein
MSALPEPAIRKSRFDFFTVPSPAIAAFTNDTIQHNVLGRTIAANWWTLFRSDAHA